VSILLRHFRWNRDRLLDRFMESDAVDLLRAAGEPVNGLQGETPTPDHFTCEICFDNPPPQETFQLRCHHRFCTECWRCYVSSKVKDEGQCTIACMKDSCKTIVDEPSVEKLVDKSCYERHVLPSPQRNAHQSAAQLPRTRPRIIRNRAPDAPPLLPAPLLRGDGVLHERLWLIAPRARADRHLC
jgi:hypothetical protein